MPTPAFSCGLEAALSVLGGKWKLLILFHLGHGTRRFGELRRLVVGVSEKVLIQHLRELVSDGVVARTDFKEIPPRVEYALTALRPLPDRRPRTAMRLGRGAQRAAGELEGPTRDRPRSGGGLGASLPGLPQRYRVSLAPNDAQGETR